MMTIAEALFGFNFGVIRQVGECQLHSGSDGSYMQPESRVA